MESDALTALLSGTSAQAPRLCRAGLSVLAALRLAALALGAKTLWRDEMGDVLCRPAAPESCLLACLDDAFPVVPFNLFLLQMASVAAHGVACCLLSRPPDSQGKGAWWRGRLRGKPQQPWLHLGSVATRVSLEGAFLTCFHCLYPRYPQALHCAASPSCPEAVRCSISKAGWKDAFILFVGGTSWVSVLVCLMALLPAAIERLRHGSRSVKTELDHPLLAQRA